MLSYIKFIMSSQSNSWQKLCKIRRTMRECRWNIQHFWYTQESPEEVIHDPITKQRRRHALAMAIAGQDGLIREVLTNAILQNREETVDSIAEVLKGELDSLLSLKAFQEFSFSAFEEINLKDVPRNIKKKAPILLRKPTKSTLLPRAIGLYCHSTGAKRRLINVLCGLGVIESYTTIRRTLDAAAVNSRVHSIYPWAKTYN